MTNLIFGTQNITGSDFLTNRAKAQFFISFISFNWVIIFPLSFTSWTWYEMNVHDIQITTLWLFITQSQLHWFGSLSLSGTFINSIYDSLFCGHLIVNLSVIQKKKNTILILTNIYMCVYVMLCRYTRIGAMVFILHDCSDIILELSKASHYINLRCCNAPMKNFLFPLFAFVFFVTRLVLYPLRCLIPAL
jgi:hypothetical protein